MKLFLMLNEHTRAYQGPPSSACLKCAKSRFDKAATINSSMIPPTIKIHNATVNGEDHPVRDLTPLRLLSQVEGEGARLPLALTLE